MKRPAKIAIIILIILLVALMWFLKNGFGTSEELSGPAVTEEKIIEAVPTEEGSAAGPDTDALPGERLEMTQEVFDMELWLSRGLPLMVDFGSRSCGPCQKMKPDLIRFYEMMEGKMTVVYLDVWEDPKRTGGLPANVVPTQYFFNADGTPWMPSDELLQKYYGIRQYTVKGSDEIVLTSNQGMLMLENLLEIAKEMGVGV